MFFIKLIILLYKNLKFRELWQDQNLWAENLDTVLLPDIMEEEVKVENSLSHKSFLILLKYIPHFIAFGYVLTTLLEFLGFNMIVFGYFIHLSLLPWLFIYIASFIFKYCYVHRLPLYYIGLNEILVVSDYYIQLPLSDSNLLIVHLLLISLLIFCYTLYYVKNNKKPIIVDN